ncbi:hypothetical protein ACFLW9_04375, partial [Chloroflexota bacterium]
ATGFNNTVSLAEENLNFPEFVYDLFRSVAFLYHYAPFFSKSNTTSGYLFGGHVRANIPMFVQW